jgi:hypothetical protein
MPVPLIIYDTWYWKAPYLLTVGKHKLDGTEIICQLRLLFTITGGLGAFSL